MSGRFWWHCRTCDHTIRRSSQAALDMAITLHRAVSHNGRAPIVNQP